MSKIIFFIYYNVYLRIKKQGEKRGFYKSAKQTVLDCLNINYLDTLFCIFVLSRAEKRKKNFF